MKFEIDDKNEGGQRGFLINKKTGYINLLTLHQIKNEPDVQVVQNFGMPSFVEVETFLKAWKKTQEKLVNKQIQEIQDSKNMKDVMEKEIKSITDKMGLPKEILKTARDYKNEENQQIVDEWLKKYRWLETFSDEYLNGNNETAIHLKHLKRNIVEIYTNATSKNIKDL